MIKKSFKNGNNGRFKKGIIPWNKNKRGYKLQPRSFEVRRKISLSLKGRKREPFSEEWRENISKGLHGKKLSQEYKKKFLEVGKPTRFKKGLIPWNKGKNGLVTFKHTEETKKKIGLNTSQKLKGHKQDLETIKKRSIKLWETRRKNGTDKLSDDVKKKFKVSFETRRHQPFKDTKIELKIQSLLKENNIEFETHYSILGHPDIFIKPNICIFVDGCYWHKCPSCGFGCGTERDKFVTEELQRRNYAVIRIWEHDISNFNLNKIKSYG